MTTTALSMFIDQKHNLVENELSCREVQRSVHGLHAPRGSFRSDATEWRRTSCATGARHPPRSLLLRRPVVNNRGCHAVSAAGEACQVGGVHDVPVSERASRSALKPTWNRPGRIRSSHRCGESRRRRQGRDEALGVRQPTATSRSFQKKSGSWSSESVRNG